MRSAHRLMLVNISLKFHEDILNGFQITERFLRSAHRLMLVNISLKFHEDILNGFQITERTRFCDGRTDRRTDDHGKNTMSPDPEVGRHKTKPPNIKTDLSLQLDHTLNLQRIYARDLRLSV